MDVAALIAHEDAAKGDGEDDALLLWGPLEPVVQDDVIRDTAAIEIRTGRGKAGVIGAVVVRGLAHAQDRGREIEEEFLLFPVVLPGQDEFIELVRALDPVEDVLDPADRNLQEFSERELGLALKTVGGTVEADEAAVGLTKVELVFFVTARTGEDPTLAALAKADARGLDEIG